MKHILKNNITNFLKISTKKARHGDIKKVIDAVVLFIEGNWGEDNVLHPISGNDHAIKNMIDGHLLLGFYKDLVVRARLSVKDGQLYAEDILVMATEELQWQIS